MINKEQRPTKKPGNNGAECGIQVYLLDGTYELFRHFFAIPGSVDSTGQEIAAVRGVIASILSMLEKGARYIGVATDHVIESFRNDLFAGYKTGEGIAPALFSQFALLEEILEALGVKTWPMVEFEADDALASAAHKASQDPLVQRVIICTPDKDLAQCVVENRVVQLDRRRDITRNHDGIVEKFGVPPVSIPDYLAVVGDAADGYPGLPGWGAKAAASVLSVYSHLEHIPAESSQWHPSIRSAPKLCATLNLHREEAALYKILATLRLDVPVFESLDELLWKGPNPQFEAACLRMNAPQYFKRATELAAKVTALA